MAARKRRSIPEINRRLADGEAVVMTAADICDDLRSGRRVRFEDVDVVTASTCGLMSGTYAVLSFPFSEPDRFVKAKRIFFNGVEADPGPCPNERIGVVDAIVHGTRRSSRDPDYGGGHLFQDLVAGKPVVVQVVTDGGNTLQSEITLDRIPHAVLHGSRHAFRNYVGFVNPGPEPMPTIFCSQPLPGAMAGATACGCGEINPIQKDPELRTIGIGTRILLNGGTGYVTGSGTRSSRNRPCLSVVADMHGMRPDLMGGFRTSAGPEVIQTWAVPIPILDSDVLKTVKTLDEEIPLVITNIHGRSPLSEATYADLWFGTSRHFGFDRRRCETVRGGCPDCPPALLCPSGAFTEERVGIEARSCYHCGICAVSCHGGCFTGDIGGVFVEETFVPFVQRLSDRVSAEAAARDLKTRILAGRFRLSQPVGRIDPGS
ncbi:MAG: methanogenesis marker 16 metalloprotein [Desulfobacteraceae bacterium]|nr:methanogenesis marker 16 metalloprotein [Desulfobacteraceae bacterium]